MKKALIFLRSFLAAGVLVGSMAIAKEPASEKGKSDQRSLAKTAGYEPDRYQILNINNLWTWHRNDGQANHSPLGDNGLFYPRGTKWVIYQDGMVFGSRAYVDAAKTIPAPFSQKIRVGGTTYATGQRAGWVDGFGATAKPHDPADLKARIYRIRRDWKEMSQDELRRDAAESNEIAVTAVSDAQVQQIVARYALDWKEWPVDIGAPYVDRNGNGQYNPPPDGFAVKDLIEKKYDEPGVAGGDPNSPADQVLWCVFNDLNRATSTGRFGSEPTGLEIQMTMWGYKRADALGNMYFRKWRFINKGGVEIDANTPRTIGSFYLDSMYVCQWSDPDLGEASDDLAGCDTDLSMGFIYNGNPVDGEFRKVSLPPPSSGYDFLQGPIVPSPGDRAVFDLKYRDGYKNLSMTGFSYFSAGSPYTDPRGGYATNTIKWYKMLRGFAPLDGPDVPYAHPPGVTPGPYPLSGDPVKKTGHFDGLGTNYSFVPGDRRILVITGPFTMAPGDTQEVVVANVAGIGADRLSSVSVLKFNDRFAQNTYDALFRVPKAPTGPDVKVAQLDGHVVFEWGSNVTRVAETEAIVNEPGAYVFEGYNLYQLPSAVSSVRDGRRIATFDLETDPAVVLDTQADPASGQVLEIPIHFGSNSGISRYFKFDRDYVRDISKLNNGEEYYIAITAYSRSTVDGYIPAALESATQVYTVVPQSPRLGQRFGSSFGTEIADVKHTGTGDATVTATVVDPKAVVAANYTVSFPDVPATGSEYRTWSLSRGAQVLLKGQTNYARDNDYLVADGMVIRVGDLVFDAPTTILSEVFVKDVDPSDGNLDIWGDGTLFGAPNGYWATQGNGNPVPSIDVLQSDLEFRFTGRTAAGTDDNKAPITTGGQWSTQWQRTSFGLADLTASQKVQVRSSFELWDVERNIQLCYALINRNADGAAAYGNLVGNPAVAGQEPVYRMSGRDYIVVLDIPYPGDAQAQTTTFAHNDPKASWLLFFTQAGASVWSGGDIYKVRFANPIQLGKDKYDFSTSGLQSVLSQADAQKELNRVGVFPNPYFALNPQETNKLSRFVTFNNLPDQATIRIFNLAGQLVRTINHVSGAFEKWNLLNNSNFPVASGMYIAHIEMPGLGEKVLKLAVVQEKEVLDTF